MTSYDGLPTAHKLKMLTVEHGLPKALHPFINEMKQVYTMEIVYAQCKPVRSSVCPLLPEEPGLQAGSCLKLDP